MIKDLLTRIFGETKSIEIPKEKFNETFSFYLEQSIKAADGIKYIIQTEDGERKVSFKVTRGNKFWMKVGKLVKKYDRSNETKI